MYRTGYCCINLSMGEKFRTMQLSWANRNSKEDVEAKWNSIIKHNFSLFYKIIQWNIENKIFLYRISSDLVPFADHEKWGYLWDNWRNTIENHGLVGPVREIIKRYIGLGGRLTIHQDSLSLLDLRKKRSEITLSRTWNIMVSSWICLVYPRTTIALLIFM
jgi:UV DNA damage endonuclease